MSLRLPLCAALAATALAAAPASARSPDDYLEAIAFAVADICPATLQGIVALEANAPLAAMGYAALSGDAEARFARPRLGTPQAIEKATSGGSVRVLAFGKRLCVVSLTGPALDAGEARIRALFDAEGSGYVRAADDAAGAQTTYTGSGDGGLPLRVILSRSRPAGADPEVTASFAAMEE